MKKLIFVYNANSGVVNSWIDMAHKIVNPSTYECHLCELTHGNFREKRLWTLFKKECKVPLDFCHKDEFLKSYKSKWLPKYDFPIILGVDDQGLKSLVTSQELDKIKSVEALIERIKGIIRLDSD